MKKKENWFRKNWQIVVGPVVTLSGLLALSLVTIFVGGALMSWWFIARPDKKQQSEPAAPSQPAAEKTTPAEAAQNPNVKTYKVAGMSHYLENLLSLADENPTYTYCKRELIDEDLVDMRIWQYKFYPVRTELVPEPDNPYDPNAIKVVVDGAHVGYIKRGSCAHLLKLISENRIGRISCLIGGGNYKQLFEDFEDDPWSADPKTVYTLEKDSLEYFVHLKIEEL